MSTAGREPPGSSATGSATRRPVSSSSNAWRSASCCAGVRCASARRALRTARPWSKPSLNFRSTAGIGIGRARFYEGSAFRGRPLSVSRLPWHGPCRPPARRPVMAPRTLIFIPTYNERENVRPMCEQIQALGLDADLVFMDDGSPDGTGAILDELAAQHPRMRAVHRAGKSGIGSAHLEGIALAYAEGYNRLVTLDC